MQLTHLKEALIPITFMAGEELMLLNPSSQFLQNLYRVTQMEMER